MELELLFFEAISVFLGLGFDGAVTTGVGFFCHGLKNREIISLRISSRKVTEDNKNNYLLGECIRAGRSFTNAKRHSTLTLFNT